MSTRQIKKFLDGKRDDPTTMIELQALIRRAKPAVNALRKVHQELQEEWGTSDSSPLASTEQICTSIISMWRQKCKAEDDESHLADGPPLVSAPLSEKFSAFSESLKNDIGHMMEETMSKFLGNFESRVKELTKSIGSLAQELEDERANRRRVEKKLTDLETRHDALCEKLEQDKRACNVVIEGVVTDSFETTEKAVNELFTGKLEVNVTTTSLRRLSTPSQEGKSSPRVIVTLASPKEKIAILRNCKKLKDHPKIKVWEDLTPKQRSKRQVLIEPMRKLRKNGKRAWLRGDKLFFIDESDKVVQYSQ